MDTRSGGQVSERFLVILAVFVAALIAALAVFWHPEPPPAVRPSSLPAGGDFRLQSVSGPVALSDYQGRLVMLYFGYTFCPDICPTTLVTLSESLSSLTADEREKVAVLFVSVDPERDTVAHLNVLFTWFNVHVTGV